MPGIGDYIKGGVEDLKKYPAPLIVGGFLTIFISAIPLVNLAQGIPAVGMQSMLAKIKRGQQPAVGDVFSRTDMDALMIGVPAAAIGLLNTVNQFVIGSGLIALICMLASIVVGIGLVWAAPFQATKKGPFMDSFKQSFEFWMKNPVGHLITLIVCGIVGALGAIACGIGVFATMPIAWCAIMGYFLDQTGQSAAPAPVSAPAV